MRSNAAWYPSHVKSINNITLELVPLIGTEGQSLEVISEQNLFGGIWDEIVSVQLVVNGLVYVHHALGEEKMPRNSFPASSTTQANFHDSFDHSMLLYFTFWGLDGVEKALEEEGGLQNPVIDSIGVGKKKLIGIGPDGDSLALGNDDYNIMTSILSDSDVKTARARGLQPGFLSFIVISASMMWWSM